MPKKRERFDAMKFCSNEAVFVDNFVRFVAAALEAGDVAIVLVTQTHRDVLDQRLKAQGLDIDAALREGTYLPLDVAETLSTFMINDMPDSSRFVTARDVLIGRAAKAGKTEHPRIVACGECAPHLLREGKADAAIQVEQLWDQLVTKYAIVYSLRISVEQLSRRRRPTRFPECLCGTLSRTFRLEKGKQLLVRSKNSYPAAAAPPSSSWCNSSSGTTNSAVPQSKQTKRSGEYPNNWLVNIS